MGMNDVGAMWEWKSNAGAKYFTCVVFGFQCKVWENKDRTNEKQPKYRIMLKNASDYDNPIFKQLKEYEVAAYEAKKNGQPFEKPLAPVTEADLPF